jgi:peroxiredoxin Q/BCP
MTHLKENEKAPAFEVEDQDGNTVSLSSLAGKKAVLFFYPKDDTSGCTKEACSLRDNYDELRKVGYEVLGISNDSLKSHIKFISKYNLPYRLLSDPEKTMVNAFGVYGDKKFLGRTYQGIIRTTFVIDEKGIIERIIDKVDTENHADQILNVKA